MGNCYTVGPNEALVVSGEFVSYNFKYCIYEKYSKSGSKKV